MIHPGAASALRGWLGTGEPLELVVLSGSMVPTLQAGDVVRVVRTPAAELRLGDIVLVEADGIYRVHRLVSRRPAWRTRGDALRRLDPLLDPDSILGRAVAVQHDGTWRALPAFPRTLIPSITTLLRMSSRATLARVGRKILPLCRP